MPETDALWLCKRLRTEKKMEVYCYGSSKIIRTYEIEDASFLRMKNVTFSYSFDKKFLNFFRSGTLYVTGENLLTATKYLGLDPEFSYSYSDAMQGFDYAKMMQPKSIKFGVNLNF